MGVDARFVQLAADLFGEDEHVISDFGLSKGNFADVGAQFAGDIGHGRARLVVHLAAADHRAVDTRAQHHGQKRHQGKNRHDEKETQPAGGTQAKAALIHAPTPSPLGTTRTEGSTLSAKLEKKTA